MDTIVAEQEIQKIVQKIVQEYQPEKIILFGSYAWGTPHEDSDVDLFVVKESEKRKIDRERELRILLFGNGFPAMDLVIYTPDEVQDRILREDLFMKDIVSKGKLLYAR